MTKQEEKLVSKIISNVKPPIPDVNDPKWKEYCVSHYCCNLQHIWKPIHRDFVGVFDLKEEIATRKAYDFPLYDFVEYYLKRKRFNSSMHINRVPFDTNRCDMEKMNNMLRHLDNEFKKSEEKRNAEILALTN